MCNYRILSGPFFLLMWGNTHSQPAFLCESDCEINPTFYNGGLGKLLQLT